MIDSIAFPVVRYMVDGEMMTKGEIEWRKSLECVDATSKPVVYNSRAEWFYATMLMARFSIVEILVILSIFYY